MTDLRIPSPQDWQALMQQATSFRRELHQFPELTWQEQQTARRIRDRLTAAGIPWRPCAETGTVAQLAPDAPGSHIALRGDIDALPIQESLDVPWRSEVDGCMHACGHDGHTAALMACALWLKTREAELPGPVRLLFQPAEEGGHGAREMIADGALEGVDHIFGWHNWPAIPFGQALCPDGVVMAGNGTFRISVQGQGGHASQPEQCRDPLLAASAITLALQHIVARRLAPQQATVVSVTSMDAVSAPTVIRDRVTLEGSIRIADMADRERINQFISETAEQTAGAYGVQATTEHFSRYDATLNDPDAAAVFRQALAAEFGNAWQTAAAAPVMASEDFSYYLQAVPGAFALIGGGQPGFLAPCHSPRYQFNDDLIAPVVRLFVRLAGLPVDGHNA